MSTSISGFANWRMQEMLLSKFATLEREIGTFGRGFSDFVIEGNCAPCVTQDEHATEPGEGVDLLEKVWDAPLPE